MPLKPDESAVVEHVIKTGHRIHFVKMTLIAGTMVYMDHLVKEGVEICLCNNNVTRDNGLMLSGVVPMQKARICPQEK
jgi:intracellular sulfur oxidation DsrE/DsrF family protein